MMSPAAEGTKETEPGGPSVVIAGGSFEYTTLRDLIPLFLHSRRITFASGQTEVA